MTGAPFSSRPIAASTTSTFPSRGSAPVRVFVISSFMLSGSPVPGATGAVGVVGDGGVLPDGSPGVGVGGSGVLPGSSFGMGAGGVGGRVAVPGRVGGVSAGGFSESLGGVVSFGGAPGGSGRSVVLLTLFASFGGGVVTNSGFVVGAGGDVVAEFFGGCGFAAGSAEVGTRIGSRGTGLGIVRTGSFTVTS